MKHLAALSIICSSLFLFACANDNNRHTTTIQWRGVDRTGIFHETGLKTSWPEEGPEMLWYFEGLGEGHSSPAISTGKIYVTGMHDGNGYLFVFDLNGNLLNSASYGAEWDRNFHGTRGTPTISDGKIFLISGRGVIYCFDQHSLNLIWKKDLFSEFGGSNLRWGFTESPLVVGNKVIATPGGEEHNIVALNKQTGELVWSTPAMGGLSSYCSPLFIGTQEVPLIVTITARNVVGLEAATGKMLWSFESINRNNIHSNTPVYYNGMLMWAAVYKGATMLRLIDGGRNVEFVWHVPELDNMMGGLVKVGDYIYASGSGVTNPASGSINPYWFCVNWYTGEIMWRSAELAVGVIIANKDMLYLYSERGEMALARATPLTFDIVGRFPVTLGTGQHWAHPIIYDGVLYVRRGDALMAFDIRD